ncbi:MAG: hypothetical protein RLZZ58_1168, partial [Pseudomonadota bacterium]
GLALAAVIVAATQGDWLRRNFDHVTGLFTTEAAGARPAISAAQAELIAATAGDANVIVVEGVAAEERNAALPFSTERVEASNAFVLPPVNPAALTAEKCLTQAIYYEAATEPDQGKAAVAQVILNRLRHPAFAKSVCGVIYQGSTRPGCQFSFACDGSLYRAPAPALWTRANTIARAALSGHVETSVGMATHYHADYVLPYWAPKLTKIEQIGRHIFYRWPGSWGTRGAFNGRYSGLEGIPAISSLFNMNAIVAEDELLVEGVPAVDMPRDVTDRRADNDVGGRIDTTKGWTPSFAEPGAAKSRYEQLTEQQNGGAGAPAAVATDTLEGQAAK